MLDRIHLAIIRAVNRQGSLTAAAQSLYLTQSALSHSIKKLEQQLGTALWQRDGRKLRLTQAGEHILALAERLLPQFEATEARMYQYAKGLRGTLRIGMECHPCYQWLLPMISPYLTQWTDVDVDVKQQFQFGGISALFNYDIDLLITPDPLHKTGLLFKPVFDYEQVLVVANNHPLAQHVYITPEQLTPETLISYPVAIERLDVYNQFLLPAGCSPKKHQTIETTDIMLHMVASGRGIAALPNWLVNEYINKLPIRAVRLGRAGIAKQIFLGLRQADEEIDYLSAFIKLTQQGHAPRQ